MYILGDRRGNKANSTAPEIFEQPDVRGASNRRKGLRSVETQWRTDSSSHDTGRSLSADIT